MLIHGLVGLNPTQVGSNPSFSQGRYGESLVSQVSGRYSALAKAGFVFSVDSGSVTLASTHTSPLAAATGTPIIGIQNPSGSGVDYHILKAGASTVSGTPGGPLYWNYALNQTISAATNGTPVCSKIGGGSSSARVWLSTATTGSTAGVLIRPMAAISAVATTGNNGQVTPILEDIGGELIVPPGHYIALACHAAGTSHVIRATIVWAELAV